MLAALMLASLGGAASAGDFMDVWVSSALEDTNVRAGPEHFSPGPNFVMRGNRTFFEDYEAAFSDDITQGHLVLYKHDEGYFPGWFTEAAFVLQYTPHLNPDRTRPGVDVRDDGSYVRVGRIIGDDEDHVISLTGYAVDAGRFRLGYSYDLSYGGREIVSPPVGAMPGMRLQWQRHGSYAFLGAKTAINQRTQDEWEGDRNATYNSALGGLGVALGQKFKAELGAGLFQQGQIINVRDTSSPLYGELIKARGLSGQLAFRSTEELRFIQSAELRLPRNSPDFVKDTYIFHNDLDGFGVLAQVELNRLSHNLLDPDNVGSTVIENAMAGDMQVQLVYHTTQLGVDLVYKDLAYILFNVPGYTSGTAIPENVEHTPQLYGRVKLSHYFPKPRLTPSIGAGLMQPAAYTTSSGDTFVQYSSRDKEAVPNGEDAYDIIGSVLGLQWDVSPSVVAVGELLYTMDNNQSRVEASDSGERIRVPEDEAVRNALGFNMMLRARF